MSEKEPNEPMSFSRFADWCRHIDSLSEGARQTVEVLLKEAGTDDAEAAEQILSSMTELYLTYNGITDISALRSLTSLTKLYLEGNPITDISALRSLTNLTNLDLNYNQITDISALRSLTDLTTLYLEGFRINDISALRSLTNLTILRLKGNPINGISVLGELAQKHLTLSTRPIDAEQATAAVKVAYASIGSEAPEIIICSSPRDAYLQIFNLLKSDRSQNSSDEWRRNRFGEKLYWEWISLLIVEEFASPLVWQYEFNDMRIESEADDNRLRGLINELVEEYKRSEQKIGNVFPDHLLSLQSPETPTDLFKQIYLTELYISSLGVNLSEKAQEILRCEKLLFEHCGFIFAFEKICYVCDRPRHLRFDSQNRWHAEGEPAIEFADGWNFYYHGVRLPEQYGQVHPDLWKAEWLLSEDNAELKRVLIEAIGYDRIIQELAAEQIDSSQEYALLKIDNAESSRFICLPPNLTSAREAIRWVNGGIDPEEFSVQT